MLTSNRGTRKGGVVSIDSRGAKTCSRGGTAPSRSHDLAITGVPRRRAEEPPSGAAGLARRSAESLRRARRRVPN